MSRTSEPERGSSSAGPPDQNRRVHPTNAFIEFPAAEVAQSIPRRFTAQVEKNAERLAIKSRDDELTFDDLNRAANRCANMILGQGASQSAPIGLVLEHGAPVLTAMVGALKAGRTYLPLDPHYPAPRCAYMVEDSGSDLIVTNNENLELARRLAGNRLPLINMDQFPSDLSEDDPELALSPDSIAYVLYTSGSTGNPKGVTQTHRNILHETMNFTNISHICKDDRMVLVSSSCFGDSVRTIYAALLNGASLHPLDIKKEGLAPLADWLVQQEVSIYRSVPTVFRHFASALPPDVTFPRIRLVYFAGEPVYKRDAQLFKEHFSRKCILVNGLGCNECFTFRWYLLDSATPVTESQVPVGYPIKDMDVLLLDDAGEEVGLNKIGEIAVKSRYLSPGYWGKPELTRERFLPDPDGGTRRTYLTGDLGLMLPDGCIVHKGRKDFQVKIRGYRVETAEIEMLLDELEGIKDSVVVARADDTGDQRLVAYVVPANHPGPTVSELRRLLSEKLPDYMVPSVFVTLDAFPLLPNGKLDRRALPAPSSVRPEVDVGFAAARNALEETLVEIWCKILGVQEAGIYDSFFDLGGHSLLAGRLLNEIDRRLGKRLPLAAVFYAPTIEQLAQVLRQATWSPPSSCLVPIQAGGSRTPLFCVPWAGGDVMSFSALAHHLGPEQPLYGLRPRGLDGQLQAHTKVEDMAAYYISEILAFQPRGPYVLAGRCFGGLVAFEMARQLVAGGREVPLIVLLDSSQPPPRVTLRSYARRLLLHHLLRGEAVYCILRDFREQFRKIKWRLDLSGQGRRLYAVWHAHNRARLAYRPKSYQGSVTLFQSRECRTRFPEYRARWSALATGGLDCHLIPGTHRGLLDEPHVGAVAHELATLLDVAVASAEDDPAAS